MKITTCPNCAGKYLKGVEELDACIYFCAARGGPAPQYHSDPFKFCPWCGSKLEDILMDEKAPDLVAIARFLSEQKNVDPEFLKAVEHD